MGMAWSEYLYKYKQVFKSRDSELKIHDHFAKRRVVALLSAKMLFDLLFEDATDYLTLS